jgi:hypothetical protein
MNLFGSRSLDDVPFFSGFALNILVWSACAYAALRKT